MFAYGHMIRYGPILVLVDLASNIFVLRVRTNVKVYSYKYS